MEIEVGEYIRLKSGLIGQFYNIEEGYDGNTEVNFEEFGYEYEDIEQFYDDIKSYSKNIIDLIEVGDYVNGYYTRKIANYNNELCAFDLNTMQWTPLTEIDVFYSIVTHEQFSSIEYKVEEDNI